MKMISATNLFNIVNTTTNLQRHNGMTWMTNIPEIERKIYEEAILLEGSNSIEINNSAYDRDGNILTSDFSLHWNGDKKDLSNFWKMVDNLKKEKGFI